MPGMPKPINSPFGNRPGSLPSPVPQDGVDAMIAQMQSDSGAAGASAGIASAQNPAAAVGPAQNAAAGAAVGSGDPNADTEALFSQMDSGSAPQPSDQFQPEGSNGLVDTIKANFGQFKDIGTRFQAGLAANDTEVMGLLKQKYGAENVRWKDGKAFLRDAPGDKFRALDPKQFEIFSDLIPDLGRGIVQEAVAAPFELAGAAAGTVELPGVGTAAGSTLGRVASAPFQVKAADAIAKLAGVPQDPSRSKGMEMAVQAVVESTMPMVGRFALKRIPGTAAYNAAKTAGAKELSALSAQSKVVAQSTAELAALDKAVKIDGSIVGVPGANVTLGAHQLNPDSPAIMQLKDKASEYVPFMNAMRQHAGDWGNLFEKTMHEVQVRATDGKLVKPQELSKTVVDAVAETRKIEGTNIAKYKMEALKVLGDKPQQVSPAVVENLQGIMQSMNFTPKGGPTSKEEVQKLIGQMGISSAGEARAISNNISDVMNSIQKNGGLNIKDMDRFRNSIGDLAERFRGTPAGRQLGALAGSMRENYKDAIASGIDNEFEKEGFKTAMSDYSNIMNNIGTLRNALDSDSSAQAIVGKFFNGRENVQMLKSIQTLSPNSFDNLRAEWLNQQMTKFKSRDTATGFQAGQFLDKLDKQYGPEFMGLVFPKEEQKTVRNFLTVLERIDKTIPQGKINSVSEKQKQGLINGLIGVVGDIKFKWVNGLGAMSSDRKAGERAAVQLLTRDGIDKYVADYPGKVADKAQLAQKLKDFVAAYRVNNVINNPATKAATRGVTKTILRPEMQALTGDTGALQ